MIVFNLLGAIGCAIMIVAGAYLVVKDCQKSGYDFEGTGLCLGVITIAVFGSLLACILQAEFNWIDALSDFLNSNV